LTKLSDHPGTDQEWEQRSDPAVAVPAGAAHGQGEPRSDPLAGRGGRVQAAQPRGGGPALGRQEEQAQHELREAVARPPLLLRRRHDLQGGILACNKKNSLLKLYLESYEDEKNGLHLNLQSVFRIHDILVWIRIRGSMPQNNESGSCYFRH
jgi:hypothetical protein